MAEVAKGLSSVTYDWKIEVYLDQNSIYILRRVIVTDGDNVISDTQVPEATRCKLENVAEEVKALKAAVEKACLKEKLEAVAEDERWKAEEKKLEAEQQAAAKKEHEEQETFRHDLLQKTLKEQEDRIHRERKEHMERRSADTSRHADATRQARGEDIASGVPDRGTDKDAPDSRGTRGKTKK